jgi:hypothetical protein
MHYDRNFLSHFRRPNLEGQVPYSYSPQEQGGPGIAPALESLFVASYDAQGSSESILTRLHTGSWWLPSHWYVPWNISCNPILFTI